MEFWGIRGFLSAVHATAGATAKIDFTGAANYNPTAERQGLLVASCGAAPAYIKLVNKGDAAPTVTATDFDYYVPALSTATIKAWRSVDVYIFGTVTYNAKEIQ